MYVYATMSRPISSQSRDPSCSSPASVFLCSHCGLVESLTTGGLSAGYPSGRLMRSDSAGRYETCSESVFSGPAATAAGAAEADDGPASALAEGAEAAGNVTVTGSSGCTGNSISKVKGSSGPRG